MRLNFFLLALSSVLVASVTAAPAPIHDPQHPLPRSAGAAAAAVMAAPRSHQAAARQAEPVASHSSLRSRSSSSQLLSLLRQRAERKAGPKSRRSVSGRKAKRAATCTKKASSSAKPSSTSKPVLTASAKATSTASTAAPASTSTGGSRKMVTAGYWPDWVAGTLPPESIDWSRFDYLNFAFATPQSDASITFSSDYSKTLLQRLITSAHANKKKVVLSMGGWGNSAGFSGAVSTAARRTTFINNIKVLRTTFDLDGFDFDWEYPNNVQGGPNSPQDTANLQTFLVALRAALPASQILSAAVPHQPWLSSKGAPVASVARAASALDYLVLMNYDVWGSSSSPGPNAPLANLCGNSTQPQANAAAGVKQWAAAGMPRSKMLLGIPAYGYISTSTKNVLRQRAADAEGFNGTATEQVAAWPFVRPEEQRNPYKRATALKGISGSTADGQINFSQLVQQGALKASSDGTFKAANGWTKYWDDCSDTPYLSDGSKVVTYDDTYSLHDKGAFAQQAGIAGVNMWSIDGDSNYKLIGAARAGMGIGK